jgi:hypothetical protein
VAARASPRAVKFGGGAVEEPDKDTEGNNLRTPATEPQPGGPEGGYSHPVTEPGHPDEAGAADKGFKGV